MKYLLVDRLSFFIEVKISIQFHGSLDGLGIGHVKPPEHILHILGLAQESPFLQLLDLKTKEELQFTHHRHLESLGHDLTKLFTKFIISRMLTVKIRQPSHEFTFGVGMTFVSYPLVLTPVV
jgi:hypothetical protein